MNDHQNGNAAWAKGCGYEYHPVSEGAVSEGVRSLDIFRKADSYRNHVLGVYRSRPFEILDVRSEKHDSTGYFFRLGNGRGGPRHGTETP